MPRDTPIMFRMCREMSPVMLVAYKQYAVPNVFLFLLTMCLHRRTQQTTQRIFQLLINDSQHRDAPGNPPVSQPGQAELRHGDRRDAIAADLSYHDDEPPLQIRRLSDLIRENQFYNRLFPEYLNIMTLT